MGMCVRCWSFGCASNPRIFNSWVAGALNSAWRAVEQYLTLNQPDSLEAFWRLWGPSEYWDEASDSELVGLSRKLLRRHLVIALHQSGFRIPSKEGSARQ